MRAKEHTRSNLFNAGFALELGVVLFLDVFERVLVVDGWCPRRPRRR